MFKRTDYELESGRLESYAFPGGYPLFYVCGDGGILCPGSDCANSEECHSADKSEPEWFLVGADVNWEDDTLRCDHCGLAIESAYGN